MRHFIVPTLIIFIMLSKAIYAGTYGGGSGTELDPYIISDPNHMQVVGANQSDWDRHFILTSDIDMSIFTGADYNVIGNSITPFTGSFDGSSHTILNLTIDAPGSSYIGLFGYTGIGAEVRNLGLENISINADYYGAGLCGWNMGGSITNCYAKGEVTGRYHIGGLCGYNAGGTIRDCYVQDIIVDGLYDIGGLVGANLRYEVSTDNWVSGRIINSNARGSVTGVSEVGGLVGRNQANIRFCYADATVTGDAQVGGLVGVSRWGQSSQNTVAPGTILDSYASGNVLGASNSIGGLIGLNWGNVRKCYSDADVTGDTEVGGLTGCDETDRTTDCYARGNVTGRDNAGGLVGRSGYNDGYYKWGGVQRCYSTGYVSVTENGGGLIGFNVYGDITSSFWDTQTSGQATSDGGEGKTTLQMLDPNTFIDAGWNFDKPVWLKPDAAPDYPVLVAWGDADADDSGKIDFADLAVMAKNWMVFDCGICDGVNLTGDLDINHDDLMVLAGRWLDVDNVTDHVFEIWIEKSFDYEDPTDPNDTDYTFELGLITDYKVERIEFLAPSGTLYELPNTPWIDTVVPQGLIETGWDYCDDYECAGEYEWVYYAEFDDADDLSEYEHGWYTIKVYYENGRQHETSAWFGIPGTSNPVPQPVQVPIITSFDHGDILTSPVTIAWEPCIDPAVTIIWVGIDNIVTEEEVGDYLFYDTNVTSLDQAQILDDGMWEVEIGFEVWYQTQNSDGIDVWVGKYSESDYEFTVAP